MSDDPSGVDHHAKNLRQKRFRFKCCDYWQTNYRDPGRCLFCGRVTDRTDRVEAVADDYAENLVLPPFHIWKSKINDCSLILKFEDPATTRRAFEILEGMERDRLLHEKMCQR